MFGDGLGVFVIDIDDNGRRLGRGGLRLGFGSGRRRAVVFLHLDGGFNQRAQLRQRDGFLQIVKRAFFQRLHGLVGAAKSGNHGNGHIQLLLVDVLHHFQARAVGHAHIGEHEGVFVAAQFA